MRTKIKKKILKDIENEGEKKEDQTKTRTRKDEEKKNRKIRKCMENATMRQ